MSGNYIPFGGNPSAYGQGPQHLFFSALGRAMSPPTPPPPPSQPFGIETLGSSDGVSGALGDMPAPSVPSPDQSISGMLGALGTGLATATGPMGIPTALGSLGLSSLANIDPSFNLGTRGTLNALSDVLGLSPDVPNDPVDDVVSDLPQAAIDPGFDVAPGVDFGFGLDTMTDASGLAAGPEGGKAGSEDGGAKGDAPGDPGDPGDTGSPSNLAGGGPVMLAGGGLTELPGGGKVAAGPGGGLDDLIPTTINGRRAAALSDGEFVIPADVVSMMGDGSSRAGTQRLYDLVKNVRHDKTGTNKQAGPLEVGAILRRVFK